MQYPSGSCKLSRIIGSNFYDITRLRGMDEFPAADINADMVGRVPPEYEIPDLNIIRGYLRSGILLVAGYPWKADAQRTIHILDEPGAIKSVWSSPAPYVRDAQELLSCCHNAICRCRVRDGRC